MLTGHNIQSASNTLYLELNKTEKRKDTCSVQIKITIKIYQLDFNINKSVPFFFFIRQENNYVSYYRLFQTIFIEAVLNLFFFISTQADHIPLNEHFTPHDVIDAEDIELFYTFIALYHCNVLVAKLLLFRISTTLVVLDNPDPLISNLKSITRGSPVHQENYSIFQPSNLLSIRKNYNQV